MKKIILACSWIILMMMSACSDWVNVSPNTDVKSEDLFTSESGFKSALIGIYGRMTDQSLYGGHMTFNFMEKLVQRYDNNNDSDDVRAKIYDYKNQSDPKNTLASIWSAMYQDIANINSLLTYLETNGHYITTEGYWEMIKGEALGLRAFHYFDLLRMWGPIYAQDSTAKAVPFRDKFNSDKVAPMAANELAHKILDDLREAEKLLKNDEVDWRSKFNEPFVGERGYRMNKYAVKALMARVYLWMENKTMAAAYARSVINECGLSLVRDNQTDVSMHDETLFGLSMYNMSDKLNSYWKTTLPFNNQLWISDNNRTTVFESMTCGINDIRYKNGFGFIHGDNQNMCRKYLGEDAFYDEKLMDETKQKVYAAHPEFKDRYVIVYAPTFRDIGDDRTQFKPDLDFDKLSKDLLPNQIFVICPHPVMKNKIVEKSYDNIEVIRDFSTNDMMLVSDLLVTDYSSVIFEYALLRKPIAFYCYDLLNYNRGFYLNYPDDLPGDVYETQQALTAYLKSPEKDTLTEKYDQFIEKYMGACDGHSSERIAAMINQYMEEAKHE